jgi:NAD+ kinase
MHLLVLGNARYRPGVLEEAQRLLPIVRQHCAVCHVDLYEEDDLDGVEADLTLVLGGDGSILRAARQMGYRQRPVLGVNLGRLGFLADLNADQLCAALPEVVRGHYTVTEHLMFECLVQGPEGQRCVLGLNEVTVQSGPPFRMIDLDLLVDGVPVSRYGGDGLIVSTPVGSTGHSLSAGGPILGQELAAFVITPICPHTLTYRPLVDAADKTYTIAVSRGSPDANLFVVVDGQEQGRITCEHRVVVRRAPVSFRLVKVPGASYYRTLRDKLHWGTQPNFRPAAEDPACGVAAQKNEPSGGGERTDDQAK